MKYIVFSNYVNAWSIKKGLRLLRKTLDVHTPHNKKNIINHTLSDIPFESTLFFTEENNLKRYINTNQYKFYPKYFPNNLLDDKYEFATFLNQIGEEPVPFEDIDSSIPYPFFLKAKHSWKNDKKIPRGYMCENDEDFRVYLNQIKNKGFKKEWFFKQKLLKSSIDSNISTSGFFDFRNNNRNIFVVTKKVLGTGEKLTTGLAVETISDPSELISRTTKILNELCYTGPFELEFFHELNDDKYYVLEINPRFWMQHGIFIDYYDNAIIKRYLDLDTPNDWVKNGVPEFKKITWVDNFSYVNALLKKDLRIIKEVRNLTGEKVYYPSTSVILNSFLKLVRNRIRKLYGGSK